MEIELPDEILLKSSNVKMFFLILLAIGFVVIGVYMIRDGRLMGWLVALFFGAAVPILTIQITQGSGYLKIDKSGIHIGTIRSKDTTYYWEDLSEFGVVSINGNKMVSLSYADSYKKEKLGRSVASGLAGVEGALPDTYGLKAEELAILLTDYKQNKTVVDNSVRASLHATL